MSSARRITTLFLCLSLAVAPSLAHARAGGGTSSSGSKGSRTYESTPAQPIQRSVTPQSAPSPSSQPAYRPAAPAAAGGGFFQRNPFLTGIAGGLLGAGLASMLFGHSAMASEGSSFGSMLGTFFQIALIGGAIFLAFTWFRRRNGRPEEQAPAYSAAGYAPVSGGPLAGNQPVGFGGGAAPAAVRSVDIAVKDADQDEFGRMLIEIQTAWSNGDLGAMRRNLTPEMLSYFSEELSRNTSRGVENRVEQVALLEGDVKEAWTEEGLDYATCYIRWSALDYTVRLDKKAGEAGWLVEGDNQHPSESAEVWTFVRQQGGGRWLLSAVQQI